MILKTQKEKLILNHYRQILERRTFDEFDLIGFFIFIRSFIDKGRYPNIFEICDTIAHRDRNKGKANVSIKRIIQNKYLINSCNGIMDYARIKRKIKCAPNLNRRGTPFICVKEAA